MPSEPSDTAGNSPLPGSGEQSSSCLAAGTRRACLVDTHCHLDMPQFGQDLDQVISRAADAGIGAIITVGSDLQSSENCLEIAGRFGHVFCSVGLHPHDARHFSDDVYGNLRKLSGRDRVRAVGETGLDYHYDHSPRDIQKEVFRKHLRLAVESGLPAIIHSREAQEDTLSILRDFREARGVLHCFSGDTKMADEAVSLGFFISIAGPVTFRKSAGLREVARIIPDEHILLETDAPYLSPEPFRGKRNEPAFMTHTARQIAELRGISYDDLARITTLNAKKLFSLGPLSEEAAITYTIRDSLYLNITNRCTNACTFCVRYRTDFVKGHRLRLSREPSAEELIRAIGDPASYSEIVFCGYGEPLYRLDVVRQVSRWIKDRGGRVRINTNGHGNFIHRRNILPELKGLVDSISISMDAHDADTYNRICRPSFANAYDEVIAFIAASRQFIPDVQVTVVELEEVDIEKCRAIADSLGVGFRLRTFNVVG